MSGKESHTTAKQTKLLNVQDIINMHHNFIYVNNSLRRSQFRLCK